MGPKAEKVLAEITAREIEKYGEVCTNEFCGVYAKFCRCKDNKDGKRKEISS
jgi:hypothetical protein